MPVYIKRSGSWINVAGSGGIVLSDGFDLTLGTRTDITLNIPLTSFKWIQITTGLDEDSFEETQQIPRSVIRPVPTDDTLYLARINDNADDLLWDSVNPTTSVLTSLGDVEIESIVGRLQGAGMTNLNGIIYLGITNDNTDEFILYTVNEVDGALTRVGSDSLILEDYTGASLTSLNGTLYLGVLASPANTFRLHSVNISTGEITFIVTSVVPNNTPGLVWEAMGMATLSGVIYTGFLGTSTNRFYLYSTALTSFPVFTQIGSSTNIGAGTWGGLGMTEFNGSIYAGIINSGTDDFMLHTVSTSTGSLTQQGSTQSLSTGNIEGVGMSYSNMGPPYTKVSDYFVVQRNSANTELQFTPLRDCRIHNVVGIV